MLNGCTVAHGYAPSKRSSAPAAGVCQHMRVDYSVGSTKGRGTEVHNMQGSNARTVTYFNRPEK